MYRGRERTCDVREGRPSESVQIVFEPNPPLSPPRPGGGAGRPVRQSPGAGAGRFQLKSGSRSSMTTLCLVQRLQARGGVAMMGRLGTTSGPVGGQGAGDQHFSSRRSRQSAHARSEGMPARRFQSSSNASVRQAEQTRLPRWPSTMGRKSDQARRQKSQMKSAGEALSGSMPGRCIVKGMVCAQRRPARGRATLHEKGMFVARAGVRRLVGDWGP